MLYFPVDNNAAFRVRAQKPEGLVGKRLLLCLKLLKLLGFKEGEGILALDSL